MTRVDDIQTSQRSIENLHVTIVGLGLMGGSLAGALCGTCQTVTGVDRDPTTVSIAQTRGLVDCATTSLAEGVGEADLVVLATPVRTILRLLESIGSLLKPGAMLMDLGSTKAQIVAEMAHLPDHVLPLGAHPMCGKERSGIAAAEPALYRGATFILTPLERTPAPVVRLIRGLVTTVGARPLLLDADRQDYLTATVSHLPYLLACSLVATADATTSSDPAVWEIVAGGYRDTSRVAGSDVTMMMDILLTNRCHVVPALRAYARQLTQLTTLVEAGDEGALRATLEHIRKTRKEMFP